MPWAGAIETGRPTPEQPPVLKQDDAEVGSRGNAHCPPPAAVRNGGLPVQPAHEK